MKQSLRKYVKHFDEGYFEAGNFPRSFRGKTTSGKLSPHFHLQENIGNELSLRSKQSIKRNKNFIWSTLQQHFKTEDIVKQRSVQTVQIALTIPVRNKCNIFRF